MLASTSLARPVIAFSALSAFIRVGDFAYNELKEAMTFEERIDRLTERHEALTQSVEMMRQDSQKHDEQIAKLGENVDKLGENVDKLARIAATALDSINALARIAEGHERRITQIDGGQA